MEKLTVRTEGIGRKGALELPLGKRLTAVRGKAREILSRSYAFSHLAAVDALDELWGSLNRYEYSLKSMLIESIFNGEWDMDADEKRRIAAEVRDGSLDSAITNWSHLLPAEDAAKANQFLTSDLLRIDTRNFAVDDPRLAPSMEIAVIAGDLLLKIAADGDLRVKVGPYGDPADENSWTDLSWGGDGTHGRISLCPAFLYFGKDSLSDTCPSSEDAYIRLESRNMMYQPKKNGERPENIGENLPDAERAVRSAYDAVRAFVKGRVDWDAQHRKFRYYNKKGRKGDFLGLPMAEKKFGSMIAMMQSFQFLGDEVFLFENSEKGLMKSEKEALASFIASLTGIRSWRVIVTGDDEAFLSLVEEKALKMIPAEDAAIYTINTADDIILNGKKLAEAPAEEKKESAAAAAVEPAETFDRSPRVFYEISTGIDMEPYYTESFMGASFYLNRMTEIIEDKPGMDAEDVRKALERAYSAMSIMMNGKLAPSEVQHWTGSASDFQKAWRLDDVRADIRERRSNRYMEISGIGDGFGFTPVKGGEDYRKWLMGKMEELLGDVWTLSRKLEENGVRFNQNTMVYKSLDAFLYYMSDAYYITERGKVHRHIMKDVKDRIEYLYTYYGLKKVIKKLGI